MSTTEKASNVESEKSNNTVIEIKISIPPFFGSGISGVMDHLGKAAREIAKAGQSFISVETKEPKKMRKIDIK